MEKREKRGLLIGAAALILVAALFLAAHHVLSPRPAEGAKTITLEIVHGDGGTRTEVLHTNAAYLGDALDERADLVSGEEAAYGLFIQTVDGETASEKDRTWWCITKAGAEVTTSADLTPIADGERYELTLLSY